MDWEIAFFDEAAAPDFAEDLIFCHNIARVLDQELQYVERLGGQFEVIVVPDNGAFQSVQKTVSEFINVHGKIGLFLVSVLLILKVG